MTETVDRGGSVFRLRLKRIENCAADPARIVVRNPEVLADVFINHLEAVSGKLSQPVAVRIDDSGGVVLPRLVSVGGHPGGASFAFEPRKDSGFLPVALKKLNRFHEIVVCGVGQLPDVATLKRFPPFPADVPDRLFDRTPDPLRSFADIMKLSARIGREIEFRRVELKLPFAAVHDPLPGESERFHRLWLPADPPFADDGSFR